MLHKNIFILSILSMHFLVQAAEPGAGTVFGLHFKKVVLGSGRNVSYGIQDEKEFDQLSREFHQGILQNRSLTNLSELAGKNVVVKKLDFYFQHSTNEAPFNNRFQDLHRETVLKSLAQLIQAPDAPVKSLTITKLVPNSGTLEVINQVKTQLENYSFAEMLQVFAGQKIIFKEIDADCLKELPNILKVVLATCQTCIEEKLIILLPTILRIQARADKKILAEFAKKPAKDDTQS